MTHEEATERIKCILKNNSFTRADKNALKLAIEALEKQATQEWISVNDRLPEDESDVLAYSRNGEEGRIYPANYAKGVWFDCIFASSANDTTTHWMPLPEPPKGE